MRKIILASFVFITSCGLTAAILPHIIAAQTPAAGVTTPVELGGYAWSSNIGWISMSCQNNNSCGSGRDYGVTVQPDGSVTGYAWSSNIGWVQFGSLSSFPTAAGNQRVNARVTGTFPNLQLEGWARACAGTTSGTCSTMASRTDGWDGWISLKGSVHSIRFNNAGALPGSFAWGSDVVGWVDLSAVTLGVVPASLTLTANPTDIMVNDPVTITWDITGAYTSCTASNNARQSDWRGTVAHQVGRHTATVQPPSGTTVYTLSCVRTDTGATDTQSVTITARTQNLAVTAFAVDAAGTSPYNPATNSFSTVAFTAGVTGLQDGQSVPYTVTLAGDTITGRVTGLPSGAQFDNGLTFSDVPAGDHTAVLRVDWPATASGHGEVHEDIASTLQDEDRVDNERSVSTGSLLPEPTISFTGPDFVRAGESAALEWEIDAAFDTTCQLMGPGLPATPYDIAVAAGTTAVGSVDAGPLSNFATFSIRCADVTGTYSYDSQSFNVEVIPVYQEI